jgi:hypothetical protein
MVTETRERTVRMEAKVLNQLSLFNVILEMTGLHVTVTKASLRCVELDLMRQIYARAVRIANSCVVDGR